MSDELTQFLASFNAFTHVELTELTSLMIVKEVEKNETLLRQGQICKHCYFVLKGCLRQYTIIDGIEKTIAFYTEKQAVNLFTSYTQQTASESNLCAVEYSELLVGTPEADAPLYEKFPQLEQLTRKMMEEDFGKTQDSFARFITSSPEERYLQLLQERPDLLQRVPQHQLASYLGITPESLSRIRKRILVK